MAILFAHPESLVVNNGPRHFLFVKEGADTSREENFGISVSEVSNNHSIGCEKEHSIFFLSRSSQELVLSHLDDVAVTQMLDYEPIC